MNSQEPVQHILPSIRFPVILYSTYIGSVAPWVLNSCMFVVSKSHREQKVNRAKSKYSANKRLAFVHLKNSNIEENCLEFIT